MANSGAPQKVVLNATLSVTMSLEGTPRFLQGSYTRTLMSEKVRMSAFKRRILREKV